MSVGRPGARGPGAGTDGRCAASNARAISIADQRCAEGRRHATPGCASGSPRAKTRSTSARVLSSVIATNVSYKPTVSATTWPLFAVPLVLLLLACDPARRCGVRDDLACSPSLSRLPRSRRAPRLPVPRSGWTTIAAALALGLAGYALQASPDVRPRQRDRRRSRRGGMGLSTRQGMGDEEPVRQPKADRRRRVRAPRAVRRSGDICAARSATIHRQRSRSRSERTRRAHRRRADEPALVATAAPPRSTSTASGRAIPRVG